MHEDLIETLLSTRDFCGNERQAAREWCHDSGVLFSSDLYRAHLDEVNRRWRNCQISAGVSVPLSSEERREAFRILETAA